MRSRGPRAEAADGSALRPRSTERFFALAPDAGDPAFVAPIGEAVTVDPARGVPAHAGVSVRERVVRTTAWMVPKTAWTHGHTIILSERGWIEASCAMNSSTSGNMSATAQAPTADTPGVRVGAEGGN